MREEGGMNLGQAAVERQATDEARDADEGGQNRACRGSEAGVGSMIQKFGLGLWVD